MKSTLILAALLLTGCTAAAPPSVQSTPAATSTSSTPSPAPTPTPTPTPTRDLQNLPIGDHVTLSDDEGLIGTMTLLAVKYTRSPYRDKPLYAAKVRTCATGRKMSVTSTEWFVETAAGEQYQAADDQGEGDPEPMYPLFERTLTKGSCVQGWIPFEIGKSAKIRHVGVQSDDSDAVARWKV